MIDELYWLMNFDDDDDDDDDDDVFCLSLFRLV